MLSACGERIYSSTICFQRLRQSQPRKKLWTFLILAMSGSSSSSFFSSSWGLVEDLETWGKRRHSFFNAKSWKKSYVKSIQRFFFHLVHQLLHDPETLQCVVHYYHVKKEWKMSCSFLLGVSEWNGHQGLESSGFFCQSDFTWNQFYWFQKSYKCRLCHFRGSEFCWVGKFQPSNSMKI